MAVNGVGGPSSNVARIYEPPATARTAGPAAAPATPVAPPAPVLSPAQARRAVVAENTAAANPQLADSTLLGLQGLVRRAAEAAARPGARLDLRL